MFDLELKETISWWLRLPLITVIDKTFWCLCTGNFVINSNLLCSEFIHNSASVSDILLSFFFLELLSLASSGSPEDRPSSGGDRKKWEAGVPLVISVAQQTLEQTCIATIGESLFSLSNNICADFLKITPSRVPCSSSGGTPCTRAELYVWLQHVALCCVLS